jgi:hypothetical protein
MKSNRSDVVLDIAGSAKKAALYFDYVVPLYFSPARIPGGAARSILPPYIINQQSSGNLKEYIELMAAYMMVVKMYPEGVSALSYDDPNVETLDFDGWKIDKWDYDLYVNKLDAFFRKYGLFEAPILMPEAEDVERESGYDNVNLTLSELRLVDASKASWDQILSFRKDRTSTQKLRKLKTFFHKNYTGKPKAFIEDDINARIEDYECVIKDWGFETKISAFSLLLSSKTLAATACGTLASTVFQAPTIAAITAISGACVELGKVSLYIARRRYGLQKILRDNPFGYIIEARRRLRASRK